MPTRTKIYFALTAIVALVIVGSGFANVTLQPAIEESMTSLGYPLYFPRVLGVWKILAAIAIVAPGFPRLKEWAYAGITFNLTGAAISHVAMGDPIIEAVIPLGVLALALASWALRPDSRRLR